MTSDCRKCRAPFVLDHPARKNCPPCRADAAKRARRSREAKAAGESPKPSVPVSVPGTSAHVDLSLDVDCTVTLGEYRRIRDSAPVVHFVVVGA